MPSSTNAVDTLIGAGNIDCQQSNRTSVCCFCRNKRLSKTSTPVH